MKRTHDKTVLSDRHETTTPRLRAAGYSLVELMVVVVVIFIILAIAIPQLLASRKSAQQAAAVAFLQNLQMAQEHHYITHGKYAATFAELDGLLARSQDRPFPLDLHSARWHPFRNTTAPALAFLLLPMAEPEQGQPYQGDGSGRPPSQDQNSNGGSAPAANPPSGGGSNPGGGSGSGAGREDSSPSNSGDSGTGSNESGGSGGGSGGSGNSPAGNSATTDRLTLHGYDFILERSTPYTWRCTALPLRDPASSFSYFSDQTGLIRRELGRRASSQSAPI